MNPSNIKTNILIVDDQVDHLRMLSTLLTRSGYEVRKALSGPMALHTIQLERPDLILLDVRMPGMNGYELCTLLKSQPETTTIPIIFLSAESEPSQKIRAFELGAVDYITKPVQAGETLARISNQLTIVQQQRQLVEQNQRLQHQEEVMRQRVRQERLLRRITQRIRRSLHLDNVLHTAVSEVQALLDTDRTLIFRFMPNWDGQVIAEATSRAELSILNRVISDPCFEYEWHLPYLQGRISSIADLSAEHSKPTCYMEMLQDLGVLANIVVPILQDETLWGLLVVHSCDRPRQWQSWERELLQQIATQLAIAIQQSELHCQLQTLNNDLERQVKTRTAQLQLAFDFEDTLKRITDRVRDTLDEDQILESAVRELVRALGIKGCNASRYDLQQRTATVVYEYTMLPGDYKDRSVDLDAFPEIYGTLMQGNVIQFCSLLPNADRGPVVSLACPIFDDQGMLGDLWLVNQTFHAYSEQDIRLVRQVTNQCAIAIRQARLYQSAQAQVEELERLNRLKDDFLSTISHELRTPLASIRVATQMLEITFQQLDITDERANRYLHILKQESVQEITLVNDLLDLQHLDAGTKPLELEELDLNVWLMPTIGTFEIRTETQQQTFEVSLAENLPTIVTDPPSLKRIVTELLNNACKYTPPGDRITLAIEVQGQDLHLQFQNFGVQIPADELSHIFDKFYRVTNADRWKHGGTGLGLTLTKKLVEYLGGRMAVDTPERSTRFQIWLPLCPPNGTLKKAVSESNHLPPPLDSAFVD
jgi:signal transduction histidine kinase